MGPAGAAAAATPAISVVVPARDAGGTLPATLAALAAQDVDEPYEIVLVADRPPADLDPRVRPVARRGPTAWEARNEGVAAARAPLLAFTDADCAPAPGWLRAGLAALRDADLVQGRVLPDPATRMGPFDRSLWVTRESGLYETANLFVRRELFDRLGGFRAAVAEGEGRARPFGEDTLFGWAARRAGARTAFCAGALVHHAVFRPGPRGYVAERARLHRFPALTRSVPELRRSFYFARWFLSPRSAALDLALGGAAAAAIGRSPRPLALAAPYAALLAARALPWRRHAVKVIAVEPAADLVGFAALAYGSLRHRTPVL